MAQTSTPLAVCGAGKKAPGCQCDQAGAMAACTALLMIMIIIEGAAHAAGPGCCAGGPRTALWAGVHGGADARCA